MNYAQLILDQAETGSRNAEFAREIIVETTRAAGIVRNLLQFSRHEQQAHSPAQVGDIIEQTLSLIHMVMRHDQICMQVEVPGGLPCLQCCRQQIQQVFMNLLTNGRES
jgi:signal transduction histidine kinase